MVHHFSTFELDESQREMRTSARTLTLQPKVFDLLVYLVRHRDRVVPKDELLDSVWPGVIVADSSLQRAVSLARAALDSAGAPLAIRTFARHGYRFCESTEFEPQETEPDSNYDDLQRRVFELHFVGESQRALEELEKRVTERQSRGDHQGAARVCVLIGQLRLERREMALAHGWHRHATRLLESTDALREKGYADILGFRLAFFENEIPTALDLAERARQAGAGCGDASLEGLGLLGVGEANMLLGHTREALASLDEAGAAIVAGGMSNWASGLVYCGMIYCFMNRSDWTRANQWTEQFDRWGQDKGSTGYPGLCRLHRAQILTVRGDLLRAVDEMNALSEPLIRTSPWVEGEVWRVTGDIHTARGDFEEALACYERATATGFDAQFEIAQLQLLDGDASGAARKMRQLIEADVWSCRTKLGQARAQYVIAAAQANDLASARAMLEQLKNIPEMVSTPALLALMSTARAELELAEGRFLPAISLMRSTVAAWVEMDAPLAAAHAHCRLARMLLLGNEELQAKVEYQVARDGFRKAGAKFALKRCEKLYRRAKRSCS